MESWKIEDLEKFAEAVSTEDVDFSLSGNSGSAPTVHSEQEEEIAAMIPTLSDNGQKKDADKK